MADNIIKLATLQDAGELPAGTEDGLALIYAERHVVDSRYVAAWSRWLLYDGARWIIDTTLHAFDRARAICRELAPESTKPAAVMTAKTVSAVVQLARADRRLAATVERRRQRRKFDDRDAFGHQKSSWQRHGTDSPRRAHSQESDCVD